MPRPLLLTALVAALALATAACDESCSVPKSPAAVRPAPDATYTVRGRVEALPIPGKPQTEFIVHHEPIPDFKGFDGTTGMPEMSMPFPLAAGLSIDGLSVGDPIEFTLAMWTTPGQRGYEITRFIKLPADTALNLAAPTPVPAP